jgi:hypothetical protein
MKKHVQLVVISMVVLIACSVAACSSGSSPTPVSSTNAAIKVSAQDLFASYSKDEKAADKLYKGRHLEVTGAIYQVGTDPIVDNAPEVLLSGGAPDQARGVDCTFDQRYASQVAELHKGQTMTVLGVCGGYGVNVTLLDCQPAQE